MYKLIVLTDSDTADGFRLAGVDVEIVEPIIVVGLPRSGTSALFILSEGANTAVLRGFEGDMALREI